MKVGIVGASGFAGIELLRLCATHPHFDVAVATAESHAGEPAAAGVPSLRSAYADLVLESATPERLDGLDLVFLAMPHGASQELVPELVDRVGSIVDLAADFRLADLEVHATWYGGAHRAPELLGRFSYGLPELFREQIVASTLVAAPGCYPTAAALALAPLLRDGLIAAEGIVVDAASGVSGAGRSASEAMQFASVDEDFRAYGLLTHRHTPEIEQTLGAQVLFTPHLAPMTRGILATCYGRLSNDARSTTTADALDCLSGAYETEPFVVVAPDPPTTKATLGSNCAHVSVAVDHRTGWVIALCAIDNLMKGASGQAVQCANLITGFPETIGLPTVGVYP
jgi:N-acetyl-gamma-glutamyl-phosphate reductase